MRDTEYYRQCRLVKYGVGFIIVQVSYIPDEYARVGNIVKLRDRVTLVWDDGWHVTEIGSRQDAQYVETNERNHLKQRKASDI